jgi:hypothetical protein
MSHWRSQQRSQVMMSADTVKMTARTEARYGVTEQHNKTGGVLPPFRALTGSPAGDDRNKAPIRVAGAPQYSSRFCGQIEPRVPRSVDKPVGPVRLRVEIAIDVHRSARSNFRRPQTGTIHRITILEYHFKANAHGQGPIISSTYSYSYSMDLETITRLFQLQTKAPAITVTRIVSY